jgi:branched-chain amino acid transport system permease protein
VTYAIVSGLMVSGMYLLLSLGFTVMLRIADMPNLAHGSFVVGGMYLVLVSVNDLGLPYFPSIPIAVIVGLLPCIVLYEAVLRGARKEGHRPQIVYTLLLLSLLQVVYQIVFGADLQTLNIGGHAWTILGVTVRREQVIGFFVAVIVCAALFAVFRTTAIGKAMEISGKYPEGAQSIGLPVENLYRLVFLLGSAMALLAGALIMSTTPVSPFIAVEYLVIAVVISIAARLSFTGCVAAAVLYGVGYQVLVQILNRPTLATIIIYGVFLVVIVATPWAKQFAASFRVSRRAAPPMAEEAVL